MLRNRKRIGLALGGGGGRGWAHLGVIRAIEEAGIPIHCIAGTSMGALVGGAFANGKVDALMKVATDLDWRHVLHYFLEFNLPRSGLVDGTRIVKLLHRHITPSNMEDASIPLRVVATDIQTGKEVVIAKGDMIEAIRASIAVPGILTPVARDGQILVDGGLVNPVPVSVARAMGADKVIAVDVNRQLVSGASAARDNATVSKAANRQNHGEAGRYKIINLINERISHADVRALSPVRRWITRRSTPSVFDIMGNTIRIIETELSAMLMEKHPPDILIQPDVGQIGFMDFHRAEEAIEAGYEAARRKLTRHAARH
ncbi:MAG: patatin-like phospholipase family protein [Kiritimatiellae bacterium]|nr:patatin-like phospholipase family protein [Kiritimatiellia bacterium]